MSKAALNRVVSNETKSHEIMLEEVIECLVAAENGDREAQFLCGKLFFNGLVVEQDYHRALYWFEKSVEVAGPANPSPQICLELTVPTDNAAPANDKNYHEASKMVTLLYGSLFVVANLFNNMNGSENSFFF